MTENSNKLTTVAYSKTHTKKLTEICKRLGLSKAQFLDLAINQYYHTAEDPREPIKDSLPKRIASLENRIIGFIKTQDTQYLSLMVKDLKEIKSAHSKHDEETTDMLKSENETLTSVVKTVETNQKKLIDLNEAMNKNFKLIYDRQQDISKYANTEVEKSRKLKAIQKVNALKTGIVGATFTKESVIDIIEKM